MLSIDEATPSPITDLRVQIRNLLDREIALGHVIEKDYETLYEQATTKIAKIEAAGLKISVRDDGELRAFLVARIDGLHPYEIAEGLGETTYSIESDYYGTKENPITPCTPPFDENDIGHILFVVEDTKAKGHQKCMFGSMFANMRWVDQAAAFADWRLAHSDAGKIIALDYASHGLLWLHDSHLPQCNSSSDYPGLIRFIDQPTNNNQIFPSGSVRNGIAFWDALTPSDTIDDSGAWQGCVVVALVG